MAKTVTIRIDGREITAPEGMMVVDVAKQAGIIIPTFCYHPKMEPVGMCRMCLVELGRPLIDRATGQPVLEADGSPKIQFSPKLETACTTPVSPGIVIVTSSDKVKAARREMVEFLLTSHPLDCPVCDKGGECPLQNQTMEFGIGESRFLFEDKNHLQKHYPLGELIWLDRERCIQCGRCVRFAHEIADDPVIAFYKRGRNMQIVTCSEPGFDSIFSGNTTDICPVGALTTADFRFGARPWELKAAAGICNHCAVGCNLIYNIRREARSGGKLVIKRVVPRQNEQVNEIWICDKGRFGYHYAESKERLTQPLVRKDGVLKPASWEEALALAAEKLKSAGKDWLALAGGRLANEDLFNLAQLGGKNVLYSSTGGGELVCSFGLPPGSNLAQLGKGSTILVFATDLHEEAPLWWLRVKQAVKRGAVLVVVHARKTRLERQAAHTLRYVYGEELAALQKLLAGSSEPAAQALAAAENLVVFFGEEGMGLAQSNAAARLCADLLVSTGHAGKVNSGLVGVWQNGNTQGAWELGFRPAADLSVELGKVKAVYIAAADPAGDSPALKHALEKVDFLVVQELFLTETARLADVVLPALPPVEREGSYTSGERRVQRFYPALPPRAEARADFAITAELGRRMGVELEGRSAAAVMLRIAETVPSFTGITYQKLAETAEQVPLVGRCDLYYAGSTYENQQGLGVPLALPQKPELPTALPVKTENLAPGALRVVPFTLLYDRGTLLRFSTLLDNRLAKLEIWVNPTSAQARGWEDGQVVDLEIQNVKFSVAVRLEDSLQQDAVLIARSIGIPLSEVIII